MSVPFADLGVPARLVERLAARGIHEAFPIQEAALPDALAGRDVVGKAATGSGKTLAFGLPLVARLQPARPRRPHALVLVPTRELAAQVQKELAQLTSDRGRRIICIYGGTSYSVARKALNHGADVVVACPGRLEDMLEQGALDLGAVTTVVVDEADRMADMGFLPAVRRLISATGEGRHVMLFSATMGPDVASLIREFTTNAAIHDVVGEDSPSDVDHFFWRVERDQRPQVVADVVGEHGRALVFSRTKHGADRLVRQLHDRGVSAVALHGDRSQAQRERALGAVKDGRTDVLVATDVAARGIHMEGLPVVVHYDPPAQALDYLHRSGRTGRAGASGVVISLVTEDTLSAVKRLQRTLGLPMAVEPRETASAQRLGAVDDAAAAIPLSPTPARRPAFAERSRVTRERPATREREPRRAPRERATTAAARPGGRPGEAVVSFFNDAKGYGFAVDGRGDDLFIHFSNIQGDGFKSLAQGQTIAFEEAHGPKGREARNVTVVGATARHRRGVRP
ncbi:MAG: DEAD/DEAH box helicase [Acidimicrobiales bacterium]